MSPLATRPKLLDLYCCEGGAGVGYERAGFDVYSVDLDAKFAKRNPFAFHAGSALDVLYTLIAGGAVEFTHKDGTVTPADDRYAARYERKGGYVPRSRDVQKALLGIDWMSQYGMYQSLPPVYTEHVGHQLARHVALTARNVALVPHAAAVDVLPEDRVA